MKAVIWTDVFQAACMIAGMLAIIIQVFFWYIVMNECPCGGLANLKNSRP
jgi:Na+/proline symporter